MLTATGRGRARVAGPASSGAVVATKLDGEVSTARPVVPPVLVREADTASGFCSITLRGPEGRCYPPRMVPGSLADPGAFRVHLLGVARIEAPERTDEGEAWIREFELEVVEIGTDRPPVVLRW